MSRIPETFRRSRDRKMDVRGSDPSRKHFSGPLDHQPESPAQHKTPIFISQIIFYQPPQINLQDPLAQYFEIAPPMHIRILSTNELSPSPNPPREDRLTYLFQIRQRPLLESLIPNNLIPAITGTDADTLIQLLFLGHRERKEGR